MAQALSGQVTAPGTPQGIRTGSLLRAGRAGQLSWPAIAGPPFGERILVKPITCHPG